nr:E3 ubiquitin-protein ligase HERC2-like isoform X1 [Pongo abelii]
MGCVVCGMKWLKMEKLYTLEPNQPRMESSLLEKMIVSNQVEQRKKIWMTKRKKMKLLHLYIGPSQFWRAGYGVSNQGCSWNTRHERARSIPLQDQHLALAILLELAVQRGTLSQMLSAILLLLQLWDSGAQETDNERSAQGTSAPLLPLLQRFQSIICRKDMPHSNGDMYLLSGPLSPSESFLRYLTLPQDNELAIDLQQMAVFVTALLGRLATPCRCLCRIALQHLIRVIFYRSEL